MQPSVWTGMYESLLLHEAIRLLYSQGWRCFESSFEHLVIMDGCSDRAKAISETNDVLDELGVVIPQAHALLQANVAHADNEKREADIHAVLRHIEISAAIGVTTVVVHPGQGDSTTREQRSTLFLRNVDGFRRIGEFAGEKNVRIGIENMHDSSTKPGLRAFGVCAGEILDLIDAIALPNVGVILDTDHTSRQRLSPAAFILESGDRLFGTHLSDCDGVGYVSHCTPGAGKVEWPEVMEAFKAIGYDGILNLEIPGERNKVLELRDLKSRHACAVTKWLASM